MWDASAGHRKNWLSRYKSIGKLPCSKPEGLEPTHTPEAFLIEEKLLPKIYKKWKNHPYILWFFPSVSACRMPRPGIIKTCWPVINGSEGFHAVRSQDQSPQTPPKTFLIDEKWLPRNLQKWKSPPKPCFFLLCERMWEPRQGIIKNRWAVINGLESFPAVNSNG